MSARLHLLWQCSNDCTTAKLFQFTGCYELRRICTDLLHSDSLERLAPRSSVSEVSGCRSIYTSCSIFKELNHVVCSHKPKFLPLSLIGSKLQKCKLDIHNRRMLLLGTTLPFFFSELFRRICRTAERAVPWTLTGTYKRPLYNKPFL
jgi:hypothetical protein